MYTFSNDSGVELAPSWAKGYSRLGAAQQGLKRFDTAIETFKKGIELDPSNQSLWAALKSCETAKEVDSNRKKAKIAASKHIEEQARLKREEIKKKITEEKDDLLDSFLEDINSGDVSESKQKNELSNDTEDNDLAEFFTSVSNDNNNVHRKANTGIENSATSHDDDIGATIVAEEENEEEDDEAESKVTDKYDNQNLGTGSDLVSRILSTHYKWKNLNPYHVLNLGIDATNADIKQRFKKLSVKVHPDRLRDVENAREAFEEVKNAYNLLLNKREKKNIKQHIQSVMSDVRRERKRLIAKGVHEVRKQ